MNSTSWELSTEQLKTKIEEWIKPDGPIAIIGKQYLEPAEGKDTAIFPPTYPMPIFRGRTHVVHDGEYRVSVELPPFRGRGGRDGQKDENESSSQAGYNIDHLNGGGNVCEIDSPQSQANRMEPLFKAIHDGQLVPQIVIDVKGEKVNLLDAGHRAADAVIRLSSLCADFHAAFEAVEKGNHGPLAKLSPTSLLFGVWDSRATQVKLPRIIKAQIRATNVEPLTRSAQYRQAADYIGLGAVEEDLNTGSGEKNPLSAEGLNDNPATRMLGGVLVRGEITRTVRINLAALRELSVRGEDRALDETGTRNLQRYVLALALICLTRNSSPNLREGCLLRNPRAENDQLSEIPFVGEEKAVSLDASLVETYAMEAARTFFGETEFESKDKSGAFESGVAEEFLRMPKEDRKKLAQNGPITRQAIEAFKAKKAANPLKSVGDLLKGLKASLPKKAKKSQAPEVVREFFKDITQKLDELSRDENADDAVKEEAQKLLELCRNDSDTRITFSELEKRVREFAKNRKSGDGGTEQLSRDTRE